MAVLEKLCVSISRQLQSYTEQIQAGYASEISYLQKENLSLRDKLDLLGPAESRRSRSSRTSANGEESRVNTDRRPTLGTKPQSLSKRRRMTTPKSPRSPKRSMSPKASPRTPVKVPKALGDATLQCEKLDQQTEEASMFGVSENSQYLIAGQQLQGELNVKPRSSFRSESSEMMEGKLAQLSLFSSQASDGADLEIPVANWLRILTAMTNMSMMNVNRAKLESSLQLRPAWETLKHEGPKKRSSMNPWLHDVTASFDSYEINEPYSSMKTSKYSRYVFHPDNRFITTWAFAGAMVILYDIMTFPMAGFDLEDTGVSIAIMWVTTVFWTFDVFVTLVRGVHFKGSIEMRPSRIFLLYARTWLLIDLSMVSVDWVFIYLTTGGGSGFSGASKIARSGKAFRAARVIRAVRLIRTIKVLQTLREMFENLKSEYLQLLIKLFGSIVCILVLSHYVTCAWFAQAHFNSSDSMTWINRFLSVDPRPPVSTEYVTSMHFSLTQLAGSQNIVPQNAQERWIASIIIVFDIVVFSSLVGIITDIMAQFRVLTYERNREINRIRQFFTRTEMKPSIEHRIWHFFRRHYRSKLRFVNESDIAFFNYLPSSLKMDLHDHLYVPVLKQHPLFICILSCDRYSMLATCGAALGTRAHATESEVFAEGDLGKWMVFITSGKLKYSAPKFGFEVTMEANTWICEVVLWTKWMHCGALTATEECTLVRVEAEGFEKTLMDRADTSDWFRCLKKYAALYAQRMSDSFDTTKPITDVDSNLNDTLKQLVIRAFGGEVVEMEEAEAAQAKAPATAVPVWRRAMTMVQDTVTGNVRH